MNTTQPPTTAGEAYERGLSFGQRSRGLRMGSVERRALCAETEAFKATVPSERMADFLAGLGRGMVPARADTQPDLQDHFPSTEKTPGAGTVEVTNYQPPRHERVPPAEMIVIMTAPDSKPQSPELPGVLILDADTAGGRRLLSRVGPGRYIAARVDSQGRIGRVRRLGLRAALSEAVSIERDWFAGNGMCNTEWPPLLRDAARVIGGAR